MEKSWKTSELRKTICPARFKKQVDVKTVFPGKLPPKQPSIPDTLTDFEVGGQSCRYCYSWFSTIFPRSEAKNGIFAATVEDAESSETQNPKKTGYIATMQPAQYSCDQILLYRFPRHPFAFNGSPIAQGGRRHISLHSASTEPKPSTDCLLMK
ncbi:MAG: hypothetical protein IKQ16_00685 [Lentisphaeria bacterium]|nr:hypothetical protein [Lentisphaeria bacterium]